jgi:hypothetical protein
MKVSKHGGDADAGEKCDSSFMRNGLGKSTEKPEKDRSR